MKAKIDNVNLAPQLLRARLLLQRAGVLPCAAVALCALGLAAWAWLLPQRAGQARVMAQPLPVPSTLVTAPPPPTSNQNLAAFYQVLGEQRYAEQQVKLLFDLAARSSLVLNQGEYKANYDQASQVGTYQIVLPVQGPYQSIWQFSMQALRDMPYAALNEISFRRDTIADPAVEARLRFTLYLKSSEPAVQP